MSAVTRVLTAPWRGWRRLRSLVKDEDHDDWYDRRRQTDPGGSRSGMTERLGRFMSGGSGSGGGAA